jgi:ribosomal protein S18 acetylase RimI-like enzyme
MLQAHAHAAHADASRIVLDVMPGRTQVVDFYRGLGYTETEPYVELPFPMVVMRRAVLASDACPAPG